MLHSASMFNPFASTMDYHTTYRLQNFTKRKRSIYDSSSMPFKKLCMDTDTSMDGEDQTDHSSRQSESNSEVFCRSSTSDFEDIKAALEESDLSTDSECSTSSFLSHATEHEEDAYADEDFFAMDTDSSACETDTGGLSLTGKSKAYALTVVDKSSEMVRIRFPFTSIRISVSDFLCLAEDVFLSSNLVDFYLNHLVFNVIDEDAFRVHVFGSAFWHRLRLGMHRAQGTTLDRPQRLKSQFGHARNYLSRVGLFDNDFALFPIHEFDHWSLAIVCNLESVVPDEFIIEGCTDDGKPLPRHPPCIIMLDPVSSATASATNMGQQHFDADREAALRKHGVLIRELLEYEFSVTMGKGADCRERFSDAQLPIIVPTNVPKQKNVADSGVYILEYAEHFLNKPPALANLASKGFDFAATYPKFSAHSRRVDYQSVIISMCKDKEKWQQLFDLCPQ